MEIIKVTVAKSNKNYSATLSKNVKYIGMECECASVFNEAQEAKQAYFIEGYHQAEKDLELTWEDMR